MTNHELTERLIAGDYVMDMREVVSVTEVVEDGQPMVDVRYIDIIGQVREFTVLGDLISVLDTFGE